VIPDARELHRVITASVLETARLEAPAGAMDAAQVGRLIFRAAAPIVHSVAPLTRRAAQRAAPEYRPRDVSGLPGGPRAMTTWQGPVRLLEGPGMGIANDSAGEEVSDDGHLRCRES
jgi:hypothetical protein